MLGNIDEEGDTVLNTSVESGEEDGRMAFDYKSLN